MVTNLMIEAIVVLIDSYLRLMGGSVVEISKKRVVYF